MPHMLDTQMEQAEMVLILAPHFYTPPELLLI